MHSTERIKFFVIMHDGEFAVVFAGSQVVFQGSVTAARTYCRAGR
jgi:hypothetical protein